PIDGTQNCIAKHADVALREEGPPRKGRPFIATENQKKKLLSACHRARDELGLDRALHQVRRKQPLADDEVVEFPALEALAQRNLGLSTQLRQSHVAIVIARRLPRRTERVAVD